MQKKVRYPNFCQTENGPLRNFSIKGEKSFYRDTPSFAKKTFNNRKFAKQRMVPYEVFQ